MHYIYPCVLTPEEEGGFSVFFPDVPAALTCGDNQAEALEMAEDALVVALSAYASNCEDIPVPSAAGLGQQMVAVPPLLAAKLALYTAMRIQGVTKVELAAKLGMGASYVCKLCNPNHRSHIGSVEAALRALGRSLVIGDRAA